MWMFDWCFPSDPLIYPFLKLLFSLLVIQLGCFPLPCLLDFWYILCHLLMLLIFSSALFLNFNYCILQLRLVLFHVCYLFIEGLIEFFHSSLQPGEYFYDHYFKSSLKHIFYLFHLVPFLSFFFLILTFWAYTSVSTFCLTLCACFKGLGETTSLRWENFTFFLNSYSF